MPLKKLADKTARDFFMSAFLLNGQCYSWIFKKCVYQPSRDLTICAKVVKFLRFKIKVAKAECGCN